MPRASIVTKILRMAIPALLAAGICLFSACGPVAEPPDPTPSSGLLKDVYADCFSVGAAVQSGGLDKFSELLPHFDSVTAETEMKWSRLETAAGVYDYTKADKIIDWAKGADTKVRGHCLVWYKSLPARVLAAGTTKAQALARLDEHIDATMRHFGSNVYCWDVVNEALRDSVSAAQLARGEIWRTGNMTEPNTGDWYAVCGEDYVKQAFRTADKARQKYGLTDVKLFYNDYSLNRPAKRDACLALVDMLQSEGIALDGIGMQAHYRLPDYLADPAGFIADFESAVKAFTGRGLEVQLTELDIRVYANANDPQRFDALPLEVEEQQAAMYGDIFAVCRKYAVPWQEGAGRVTNVTTWGIADSHNAWNGVHKEFPLLFGTDGQAKKAYYEITSF